MGKLSLSDFDPAKSPDETCEQAFRDIVTVCAQAIDVALAEFLETERESGPHKARVALRRLTTALDAFAPILRRKMCRHLRRRAKKLFRALGEVRDSDVFTQNHAHEVGHEQRLKRNLAIRFKVRSELRRDRAVTFTGELMRAVLPGGDLFKRSSTGLALREADVVNFAARAIEEAWQECRGYGPSIETLESASMHEFRKDMKSLRYLCEFFVDQFPEFSDGPFDRDLRDMQDCLGVLNDYAVALQILGEKRPSSLPDRERKALTKAEQVWRRLATADRPWRIG